jgi:hypothetical protein
MDDTDGRPWASRRAASDERGGPTGTGLDRIREGLGYRAGNVVPACGPCHRLRGFSLTPAEVKLIVEWRKAAKAAA